VNGLLDSHAESFASDIDFPTTLNRTMRLFDCRGLFLSLFYRHKHLAAQKALRRKITLLAQCLQQSDYTRVPTRRCSARFPTRSFLNHLLLSTATSRAIKPLSVNFLLCKCRTLHKHFKDVFLRNIFKSFKKTNGKANILDIGLISSKNFA